MVASALSFGVLGWLVAHLVTYWVVGHYHGGVGGLDPGVLHVHGFLPAAALLVGCLASVSLLAIFAVAALSRNGPDMWPRASLRGAARRASLLATVSFVVAEFIEHALTGQHQIPPAAVLIIGSAVQAFIGAGVSLLWRQGVQAVIRLAMRLRGDIIVGLELRGQIPPPHWVSPGAGRRASPYAGRAPPIAAL
jgi:hypothetical protein